MKNATQKIKILILVAILVYTALSAFGGFVIKGQHMLDDPGDLISAGDTFIESSRWNSFPITLLLSLAQICSLFSSKRAVGVFRVIAASISLAVTLLYKPLWEASAGIMGGLISYSCEITWLGYIAIVISFAIVILQIYTLKKPG